MVHTVEHHTKVKKTLELPADNIDGSIYYFTASCCLGAVIALI